MGRSELCELIPHSGSMCLLDAVTEWDGETVVCTSTTHRDPKNPLCDGGALAAICGVEYAAQAMAVHGGLLASRESRPKLGYIASIRDVKLYTARLDDVSGKLVVRAERLSGDDTAFMYRFRLSSDSQLLLEGQAMVVHPRKINA